jgi:ABC-type amino acid transport system permease subunit
LNRTDFCRPTTALVYLLGLTSAQREMFAIAQDSAVLNANLSPLTAAGLIYLALTVPMSHLVNWWERRLREGPRLRAAGAGPPVVLPES